MTSASVSRKMQGAAELAARPWTIRLLQQSAFFKLRTTARHDRCQPLRRCRATSPCRGGFSRRENVSAVVLRPCTTARHARHQPPPPTHHAACNDCGAIAWDDFLWKIPMATAAHLLAASHRRNGGTTARPLDWKGMTLAKSDTVGIKTNNPQR